MSMGEPPPERVPQTARKNVKVIFDSEPTRHWKLTVYGRPQPKGSKQPYVNKSKEGKTFAGMKDTNPKAAQYQRDVRALAGKSFDGPMIDEAATLIVTFCYARPKGHFGSGKNSRKLKASAPMRHTQKPDNSKTLRTIEDALIGVVIRDDSQFDNTIVRKKWDSQDRVEIEVLVFPESNTPALPSGVT